VRRHKLQPGDVIKLGMHEITYSRADLPAEPGEEARATQTTVLQDSDYDDDPDTDDENPGEAPYSSIARGS
jgi:pSer/pThr/pTyr-binding forkhead associated (FHA) protein